MIKSTLRWLYPGLKVKRWLALILAGVALIGFGAAAALNLRALEWLRQLDDWVSLMAGRAIPAWAWGLLLCLLGLAGIAIGLRQMIRSIIEAISPKDQGRLGEALYLKRARPEKTAVVAIGGGTGLSTLLRGMKEITHNLAAVVTVSDDGGSSGRLRREMGMLPPGDIRNCLVALADAEPLMTELFQYRFPKGQGLDGHSFGNLLIAALTSVTGDFEQAVKETSRVLAIRGRVLPATLEDVRLQAELEDGRTVEGETGIAGAGSPVKRVRLVPPDPPALDEVIEGMMEASLVVVGPGSLYTSLLPNLLVGGIIQALRETAAVTVFVCNVMTQPGETDGFTASRHLAAVLDHIGENPFSYMLVNDQIPAPQVLEAYQREGAQVVEPDLDRIRQLGSIPVAAPLLSLTNLARHDPYKLASAVLELALE